jgi:hypothetical protein
MCMGLFLTNPFSTMMCWGWLLERLFVGSLRGLLFAGTQQAVLLETQGQPRAMRFVANIVRALGDG